MTYSIVIAPAAFEDLDAIWDYLAIECENENAASRTVEAILTRIETLSDFPESGTPLDARCIIHSNYRFTVSGPHLAFYRIVNDAVHVDRILDSKSDFLQKLFGLGDSAADLYR